MPRVSRLIEGWEGNLKQHFQTLAEKALGVGVLSWDNDMDCLTRFVVYSERLKDYRIYQRQLKEAMEIALAVLEAIEGGEEPVVRPDDEALMKAAAFPMRCALHRWRAEKMKRENNL